MKATTSIGSEKYVSFTTYRNDGTPKATAVRIVGLEDEKVGFTTVSTSWKIKRLENDPRVQLQPCDVRGVIRDGTSPINGTAVVVEGAEFQTVSDQIANKYGFGMFELFSKVAGLFGKAAKKDRAVVITLD